MRTAHAAVVAYKLAPADQSGVTTAIQALSAASGELIGLITSFTSNK